MGFDPFLVELEANSCREEVVVLRLNLAPICWLPVFFFFSSSWFFGRWVLIFIGLAFLFHWWVLMILPSIGWVMIWLDWVLGCVGD